jgi:hypothetical protein
MLSAVSRPAWARAHVIDEHCPALDILRPPAQPIDPVRPG